MECLYIGDGLPLAVDHAAGEGPGCRAVRRLIAFESGDCFGRASGRRLRQQDRGEQGGKHRRHESSLFTRFLTALS